MKAIVVLSGGMDSSVALAHTLQEHEVLGALTFRYGSKHNDREWLAAQAIAAHYGVRIERADLDFVAKTFKSDLLETGGDVPEGHYADLSMKRTVVPFRNGIMLAIATGYAESKGADAIVLGNHFGDHAIYPDCRPRFVDAMAQAMELGTYAQIKLLTPFVEKTKTDIARVGDVFAVPFALTYSCYNGREKHCGKCGTCFERKEAFADAGLADPTEYE
jgi:7-cyano-7-deazaguanine synthase